jgi:hypothetical protein
MVETLNELGYDVYLHDYLSENINYHIKYQLFIGHNKFFHKIASSLSSDCRKILLTTGCSPEYDNAQLALRNNNLKKLRSVNEDFYSPITDTEYAKTNCEIADDIFMIGSTFIKEHGWYTIAKEKAYLYNNVSLFDPEIKDSNTNTFVFMASNGQLRRGLDLILEVFAKREERIYICGPFDSEPLFVKYFERELYQTQNIISIGFVNQNSNSFRKIIDQADYAILPSCSEGQSGSLLTLMNYGLIPVATDNVGFENIEELGIKINDFTVNDLNNAVDKAVNLTREAKKQKRKKIFDTLNQQHTPNSFKSTFSKFIQTQDKTEK